MHPEPSYVLRKMGLSEDEAYSSVRFSFSVENTPDEVERAASTIVKVYNSLGKFSALVADEN